MRALFNSRCSGGLLAVIISGTAFSAWGAGISTSNSAPSAEPSFRPGDTLAVASERADVMYGAKVVSSVRKGQQIIVVEVRQPWIGTYVIVDNQKKAGWIRSTDFIPTAAAAQTGARFITASESSAGAQSYTAYKPVAEPAPASPRICVSPSPSFRVDDDFLIGKYDRHEVDPNVHVWEPWRH
jgi:hypothetical protein